MRHTVVMNGNKGRHIHFSSIDNVIYLNNEVVFYVSKETKTLSISNYYSNNYQVIWITDLIHYFFISLYNIFMTALFLRFLCVREPTYYSSGYSDVISINRQHIELDRDSRSLIVDKPSYVADYYTGKIEKFPMKYTYVFSRTGYNKIRKLLERHRLVDKESPFFAKKQQKEKAE